MRGLVVLLGLVVVGGFSACNARATAEDPMQDHAPVACDLDSLLATRCRECHTDPPRYGAPMPLIDRGHLLRPSKDDPNKTVYERMLERVTAEASPMPPSPNPRLLESELAILRGWGTKGHPAATETCAPPSYAPLAKVTCTPDLPLAPANPFAMPAGRGDEYVCYGVDIARDVPTHVTAFIPRVDNAQIVHHIVLFESHESYPSTPTPCEAFGSLQWRMLMGWAPGAQGFELPPVAGFPLATKDSGESTHYVVQIHYSNPGGLSGLKDATGFDLCTSAPRPFAADVMAFGTHAINLPPRSRSSSDCKYTMPDMDGELHVIAAMPHMHKLGAAMSTKVLPADGTAERDLGTVPQFSFDGQTWVPLGTPLRPKDVVHTTCTWENPTSNFVGFGERTAEEMCYSFTMYFPRLPTLFSWAAPAATCRGD